MSNKILVLNGPNLNLLGVREPGIYGKSGLAEINAGLKKIAEENGIELETFQSNAEFEIINKIHSAMGSVDYIVINPAAFTHTSVAIRDALLGVKIPFFEVHISNVHAREEFRHNSYLSGVCIGQVVGFKENSYKYALLGLIDYLKNKK